MNACICLHYRAGGTCAPDHACSHPQQRLNDKAAVISGAADLDTRSRRDRVPKNLRYVCMTQYDKNFSLPVVIPRIDATF